MSREIADSIVVGGGIVGLMTAWELVQAGQRVTLFDQHSISDHGAGQASWAAAGILSPLYPWHYPKPVNQLAALSLSIYDELLPKLGRRNRCEYTESGMLILDKSDVSDAQRWAQSNPHARLRPELLLSSEVPQYELDIIPPENGAIRLPKVAQIRPPRLLRELERALRKLPCTIITKRPVLGLAWQEDRLAGVRTGDQIWPAKNVIICAGSLSTELLGQAGLIAPIRPVRGQMLRLQAPRSRNPLRHIVMYNGTYLVPRADGSVLLGATMEESDALDITAAGAEELLSTAELFYPKIRELKSLDQWSGLRPATKDSVPYIGPVEEVPNLYLNSGHYRSGITIAPASARLMRQIIMQEMPSLPLDAFALNRETQSTVHPLIAG